MRDTSCIQTTVHN